MDTMTQEQTDNELPDNELPDKGLPDKELPDKEHEFIELLVRNTVAKHQTDANRAYYVRDQLLPLPEFLPEELLRKIPGEEDVAPFAAEHKVNTEQARGYINILRYIMSIVCMDYFEYKSREALKSNT